MLCDDKIADVDFVLFVLEFLFEALTILLLLRTGLLDVLGGQYSPTVIELNLLALLLLLLLFQHLEHVLVLVRDHLKMILHVAWKLHQEAHAVLQLVQFQHLFRHF